MPYADKPQPLLSRPQIIKLSRLLPMLYKPSEIAEVLDVSADTVRRSYLKAGCPFDRDEKGNIWIVGTAFRAWAEDYLAQRKKPKRPPMKPGEGWCFKCNEPVLIANPEIVRINHYLERITGTCPNCGTVVNRAKASSGR